MVQIDFSKAELKKIVKILDKECKHWEEVCENPPTDDMYMFADTELQVVNYLRLQFVDAINKCKD